jgi:glycosyltransferase involved in cell wall biosynthesis
MSCALSSSDNSNLVLAAPTPRVIVAVPSYNQGKFLDATLRSIFAQPVDVEVMLADAGSTDDTRAVIERWRDRLAWWRSAPDQGQAAAINEAIARSRAPLVCWLNSDDLFLPAGLSALVEAIEADPSADVVYGLGLMIDEAGRLIGRQRVAPFTVRGLSRGCIIPQPASIVRRKAWERVGGLDEKLHFSHDYDLWWRLYHAGSRFVHINVDIAGMRLHSAAKSVRQAAEMYAEAKSVVHRHFGSLPLIWRLREPFSVGGRKEGSVLERLVRAWRRWSVRVERRADRALGWD